MIDEFRTRFAALEPERFDMALHAGDIRDLEGTCADILSRPGTAGCLAGWFCAWFAPEAEARWDAQTTAGALLGLSGPQQHQLFMAGNRDRDRYPRLSDIPHSAALATLDHFITTGEVQWN